VHVPTVAILTRIRADGLAGCDEEAGIGEDAALAFNMRVRTALEFAALHGTPHGRRGLWPPDELAGAARRHAHAREVAVIGYETRDATDWPQRTPRDEKIQDGGRGACGPHCALHIAF
jgi:hypothetical protein